MPTKEELVRVVPPEDVRIEIGKCVEKTGLAKDKIKALFYKVLASPSLDNFTNLDERCRHAMYIMNAQIKAKMPSESSTPLFAMDFVVFAVTGISTVQSKPKEKVDPISKTKIKVTEELHLAKVYGAFVGVADEDPNAPQLPLKYGVLTLWGDACQFLQYIRKGEAYKCRFSVKSLDDHYDLTLNKFEKPEPIENKFPAAKDIIADLFVPFPVSQVMYHVGERQVMQGRIVRTITKIGTNNKNRGFTIVQDAETTMSAPQAGEKLERSIMWFNAPEFATEYSVGTECYFIGQVKESEQYGISIFGECIIPIVVVSDDVASIFDDDLFGDDSGEAAPTPASAPQSFDDAWSQPAQSTPTATTSVPTSTATTNVPSPAAAGKW